MQIALAGVQLGLALLLGSIPMPGEGLLAREELQHHGAEFSTSRESHTAKEEGNMAVASASDLRGQRWEIATASENAEEDLNGRGERPLSLRPGASLQSWSSEGLEEPMCKMILDRGSVRVPYPLEVVGLLTRYDSGFLKALSKSTWSETELEEFGMCPTDVPQATLLSLQRVSAYLANPGESHFLLLHLEEGKCVAGVGRHFSN